MLECFALAASFFTEQPKLVQRMYLEQEVTPSESNAGKAT